MEGLEAVESLIAPFAQLLRLAAEAVAIAWVAIGLVLALVSLIAVHLRGQTASFRTIRLTFSRYLSLALEFQLAADILSTAIAPTFDELGKLAITAVIRTGLNYFLTKEIREFAADPDDEMRLTPHATVARPSDARVAPS